MAYGGLIDSYGAYMRPFCRRHSIKKFFISAFKLLSTEKMDILKLISNKKKTTKIHLGAGMTASDQVQQRVAVMEGRCCGVFEGSGHLSVQLGQLLTAGSVLVGGELNFELVEFGERRLSHAEEVNRLRQQLGPLVDCVGVVTAFLQQLVGLRTHLVATDVLSGLQLFSLARQFQRALLQLLQIDSIDNISLNLHNENTSSLSRMFNYWFGFDSG